MPLRDEGTAQERLYYSTSPDGGLLGVESYPPSTRDGGYVTQPGVLFEKQYGLTLAGDALYLLAPTYGIKLYALDANLGIAWARQIRPMSDTLDTMFAFRYPVAQDERGRVWVAAIANPEQVNVDTAHFGHSPAGPGRGNVVVFATDARTGAPLSELAMGSDRDRAVALAGLHVRNEEISIVGRVSIVKFDVPNHTHDADIFLSRAAATTLTQTFYKAIDLDKDDWPATAVFLDNGKILIGGANALVQVDSGSVVEYGSGFLARLSSDGNVERVVQMREPRNVEVVHFVTSISGDLIMGGLFDGPITHTSDTHAYPFWGRARF